MDVALVRLARGTGAALQAEPSPNWTEVAAVFVASEGELIKPAGGGSWGARPGGPAP